jgi:hypothetical protein
MTYIIDFAPQHQAINYTSSFYSQSDVNRFVFSNTQAMRTIQNRINLVALIVAVLFLIPIVSFSQDRLGTNSAKLVIKGTSNIHDWIMTSEKGSCSASFVSDATGNPTAINNLNFIVSVTTLKSEKGSTMDNNAYKAMAAEKYPAVKFVCTSGTVKSNAAGGYTITAPGKLSISSGTKDVTLVATGKMNSDKSIKVDGSYKLKTTDYNVKAISIMLGAIKTSADVTIVYSMTMKPE